MSWLSAILMTSLETRSIVPMPDNQYVSFPALAPEECWYHTLSALGGGGGGGGGARGLQYEAGGCAFVHAGFRYPESFRPFRIL